jgi:4-amino-4-deoxy-L-arabinose transferase-like glycosyltransferase
MPPVALVSTRDGTRSPVPTSPRGFLGILCLVVVLVRATYVPRPLRIDEGGYLLIARHWHSGGEFLYGDYFVDRPPLLMLIFRAASFTEWDQAIRVIAIPFAVLFVLAGWRAGTLLAGPAGGRWAALVGGGVMCSPGLAADQADGELFGAALVMTAVALTLSAWHHDRRPRRLWTAAAAGAVAAGAPLVKQNLLEGVLFLAGLIVFAYWGWGAHARHRAVDVARGAVLGALVPCAAVGLWLASGLVEPAAAWQDLVGFRGAALEAIWGDGSDVLVGRAFLLAALGLVTGLVPVLAAWAGGAGRSLPGATPERRTITLLFLFGLAAITAGGSYWPPYLLQLGPAAVLAAGAVAPLASSAGAWMRAAARTVLAAAALGTVAAVVVHATVPPVWYSQRIGDWLADAKDPGDTGFVAYGHASVLETADLPSPYPHLWSVPMRTLDPEQTRLRTTLAGSRAPSWIVQVNGLNAWRIDDDGELRALVQERYRVVAEICGEPVWLRRDLARALPPTPPC